MLGNTSPPVLWLEPPVRIKKISCNSITHGELENLFRTNKPKSRSQCLCASNDITPCNFKNVLAMMGRGNIVSVHRSSGARFSKVLKKFLSPS